MRLKTIALIAMLAVAMMRPSATEAGEAVSTSRYRLHVAMTAAGFGEASVDLAVFEDFCADDDGCEVRAVVFTDANHEFHLDRVFLVKEPATNQWSHQNTNNILRDDDDLPKGVTVSNTNRSKCDITDADVLNINPLLDEDNSVGLSIKLAPLFGGTTPDLTSKCNVTFID